MDQVKVRRFAAALRVEAERLLPECSTRVEFDRAVRAAAIRLGRGVRGRTWTVIVEGVSSRVWDAIPEETLLPEQEAFIKRVLAEGRD